VEVHFGAPVEPTEFTGLTGVTEVVVEGNVLRCRLDGQADALVKAVARHTVISLVSQEPDLEELFLTYYRGHPDHDPPENTDAG
jgi:ABC-2 type transport system ATP-binding protein